MSSHTSRLRTRSEPGPTVPSASLASLIGFPVAAFALLVVASYPLASVAVLAVTALATPGERDDATETGYAKEVPSGLITRHTPQIPETGA